MKSRLLGGVLLLVAAFVNDSSASPELDGYIDVSFNYNLNRPADRGNKYHPYHTKANSFGLGTVHWAATGGEGAASYLVEVDSGMYAGVNSGNNNRFFDVQEAYLTWKMASLNSATLKVGKFVTLEGIEVIESPNNPVVTHGILFTWAEPFTHVGALVQIPLNEKFDVSFGAVNGWDLVEDNNDFKTLLARLGGSYGYLSWGLSAYYGKEEAEGEPRTSVDLTGVWKASEKLALNFQGNFGMEEIEGENKQWENKQWLGAGLQPVLAVSDKVSVSARGEFFQDKDGARVGIEQPDKTFVGQTLISLTGAVAYQLGKSTRFRCEVRLDSSDEDVFQDNDGKAKSNQVTATAQFVQSF